MYDIRHNFRAAASAVLIAGATYVPSSRVDAQIVIQTSTPTSAEVDSRNNGGTGLYTNQSILTVQTVTSAAQANKFGKLFTVDLGGQVYAQPLYVPNLTIAGVSQDVVFVSTMNNDLYAINAKTGAKMWYQNYGTPIVTSEIQNPEYLNIVAKNIGYLSTGVIDRSANIWYNVRGQETTSGGVKTYGFELEGISLTDGSQVLGPVSITGQYKTADLSTPLVFEPKIQNQRASLTLANRNIYIAFASHNDNGAFHGYVFAYNASTLKQVAVFSDTTIGTAGGIWMAGSPAIVDTIGNLYYSTGNGSFGTTPNHLVQTGNSFIKLSPTLELLDWFTPYNSSESNEMDADLGASGLTFVPNPNAKGTPQIVGLLGGGKPGELFLTNPSDLGKFNSSENQVTQEFQAVEGTGSSHIHGPPVCFLQPTGLTCLLGGENDKLKAWIYNPNTGTFNTTPSSQSSMTSPITGADGAMPGWFISVSGMEENIGTAAAPLYSIYSLSGRLAWASFVEKGSAVQQNTPGVLMAFNPETLATIWSSQTNTSRDAVGMFAKDVPPVIAGGQVFLPTFGPTGTGATTDANGQLVVYGILPSSSYVPLTYNLVSQSYKLSAITERPSIFPIFSAAAISTTSSSAGFEFPFGISTSGPGETSAVGPRSKHIGACRYKPGAITGLDGE